MGVHKFYIIYFRSKNVNTKTTYHVALNRRSIWYHQVADHLRNFKATA